MVEISREHPQRSIRNQTIVHLIRGTNVHNANDCICEASSLSTKFNSETDANTNTDMEIDMSMDAHANS
jgi:hypothetical protein